MSAATALRLLLPTKPAKTINSQLLDGNALKKTRPRRTVGYGGGIGQRLDASFEGASQGELATGR